MPLKFKRKEVIIVSISIITGIICFLILIPLAGSITTSHSYEWVKKKEQIEALENRGQINNALIEAENLVSLSKSDVERAHGLNILGGLNQQKGNNVEAMKNYEESLALAPNQMQTQEILINLYLNQKEFQKANKLAVELAESANNRSAYHYHLAGQSFQDLNNKEMAEYYFKKEAEFK